VPAKTVVDAGPLVALFDQKDQYHQKALDFSSSAQADFIHWVAVGAIELAHLESGDLKRIAELIVQYADLPMDFADASLVAVCERLGIRQVATLDSDFHVYRLEGKDAFHNVFTPL
jgi:predicted nucleic acid-binding protein